MPVPRPNLKRLLDGRERLFPGDKAGIRADCFALHNAAQQRSSDRLIGYRPEGRRRLRPMTTALLPLKQVRER